MADQSTFTIEQFCSQYHISKVTYWRLQKDGEGPRELRVGRRVLITAEADREWREKLEAEQAAQGVPRAIPVYSAEAAA